MSDLEKMPGIPTVAKQGGTRSWFYRTLSRRAGESMTCSCTRVRGYSSCCEKDGLHLSGNLDMGWCMVEKTGLSDERKERLIARLSDNYGFKDV